MNKPKRSRKISTSDSSNLVENIKTTKESAQSNITDIERGLHCPTINKLELIAKALKVEPYVLFQNPEREENIMAKIISNRQYNQKEKNLL